ncbi:hypothetical protein KO498_14920 [Lentibacter algarum]|uniref:hypothetical protein n=1 Tax=Lentibacter algarum TaxID=576131 RepID=UPI001C087187|nr:hypothetical protein [Lentibacter algarum]MBU2983102.1 hypothetical protein [Lentibacter algarum]
MGRFIGQLLGFIVGAVIGLAVSGSVLCDPIVVAPDNIEQRLLDISSEAAMMVLVEGGNLINRCTLVGWSFDLGNFGFMLLAWGVPLLFACLGWFLIRRIWRKPRQ